MPEELIPIAIVLSVFGYLALRKYLDHQQKLAALQRGILPELEKKENSPRDHRLASMIWVVVGLGYVVAILFSVGIYKGLGRASLVAVWGCIPIAVGVALYAYQILMQKGGPKDYLKSALVLTAVGLTYMLCIFVSVGSTGGLERATAAGIWGIIPLAIGGVLFKYNALAGKAKPGQSPQDA